MGGPSSDDRARVGRAATALSTREREVLVLAAGLGLSNREIAARLQISELRAARLLASAIIRFGRALERGK